MRKDPGPEVTGAEPSADKFYRGTPDDPTAYGASLLAISGSAGRARVSTERTEQLQRTKSLSPSKPNLRGTREADISVSPSWPLVGPDGNRTAIYLIAKRSMDIVGSLLLIVLLSPLIVATFLVLLVTTKGHPIFCQQRLGFCGRPFRLYKFRTMVLNAAALQHQVVNQKDGPIFKNANDPRVTWLGHYLRRTSVDELPQLFNVLFGRMSLVGPRPPLAKEVAEYEPWQRRRLAVKPGLTCLWQVCGRSQVGFEEWMRMDIWYLENQGLRTDLQLLLRTPWSVLSRRGAF